MPLPELSELTDVIKIERWGLLLTLSTLAGALGACSTVGPVSIDQGRTSYNEVIQQTSEEQTLLNLVRVHSAETPLFMDVTEVDAVTAAQVNVSGTESGLGSIVNRTSMAGTLGSSVGAVMAGAQYGESPTVRYQPLLGAALVAQVSTPVSATSIVNLYNSGWPLGSIFDLTVTRFTPGFDEYHAALDALMTLDRYGALILEAKTPERPTPTALKDARVNVTVGQSQDKGEADLIIYFRPGRLRSTFRKCDVGTKLRGSEPESRREADQTHLSARNLWLRVMSLYHRQDGPLVLSLKSGTRSGKGQSGEAPLLQTRSALGMLNIMASGDNLVRFASKESVEETLARTPDTKGICHASFYRAGDRDDFENRKFTSIDGAGMAALGDPELNLEREFGDDRRLILVQVTTDRPGDTFVSVFHRHHWYSIRDEDLISKRNLALVAQIATIQAVAPQTPALTPTINVGAR